MLTPEDKNTLIQFAGPLFAMSKEIDGMYYNDSRPKTDGIPDSGIARGIQDALERDFRASQAHPRPQPVYQAPVYQQPPVQQPPQPLVAHPDHNSTGQQAVDQGDQLEFNFNQSKQDITNTLLEAQNKLLKELNSKIDVLISLTTKDDKNKGKQS
jgi:hypothetical protein